MASGQQGATPVQGAAGKAPANQPVAAAAEDQHKAPAGAAPASGASPTVPAAPEINSAQPAVPPTPRVAPAVSTEPPPVAPAVAVPLEPLPAVAPAPEPPAEKPVGPSFKVYGFARLDAAYASGRMQNIHFGLWALSPDANGDNGNYARELTINPRWSRIGLDWDAGALGGESAKISAKIEMDFHGGGSESRATPRMLQAYGQVQMGDFTVLGGQAWDLYAPLMPGGMEQAIFWYGGNLGDRRPQLRLTYAPSFGPATLVIAGAAAQSGAVDMEDLDGNGVMDGNAWARPAGQGLAEAKLKIDALGSKPLRFGASGHYGGKTLFLAGSRRNFDVYAIVGHLELPIQFITLRAEIWSGKNVNDLRGGIGQGIALTDTNGDTINDTGRGIAASGGWVHASLTPVDWYSVTVGVGRDKIRDAVAGQRSKNDTFDFANVFTPWKPVKLGLVYNHYWTDYVSVRDASVHRFMMFTQVSF